MTAQIADSVLIDGETFDVMGELPLGPVWNQLPAPDHLRAPHTALWRGYVASWAVEAGRLCLAAVSYYLDDGPPHEPVPDREHHIASWVAAQVRIAAGKEVRHVHAGHESRFASEFLLDIENGAVRSMEPSARASKFGSAGPYQLTEHVGGGGFGRVYAGVDVDGLPVTAKYAIASEIGDPWNITCLVRPDGRRVPMGAPSIAVIERDEGRQRSMITPDIAAAALTAQHALCLADGGRLLPVSCGIWAHEPSGLPALVMEVVHGRTIADDQDVAALLAALAEAVGRGLFDAHGDLKTSHVVIEPSGTIRLLDPSPPLADGIRAITPLFNPHGWVGPAGDVAACGWMMRYRLPQPNPAWEWAHRVCDFPDPPDWAHSHASARDELLRILDRGPAPLPSGWSIPEVPDPQNFLVPAAAPRILGPTPPAGSAGQPGGRPAPPPVGVRPPATGTADVNGTYAGSAAELAVLRAENARLRATNTRLREMLDRIAGIALSAAADRAAISLPPPPLPPPPRQPGGG